MSAKIKNKLKKELDGLDDFICFTLVPPTKYEEVNFEFTRYMLGRGARGVYITANQPYTSLTKKLEKEKISTENIFFIDGISGDEGKEAKNCVYLNSLENLTGLGIILNHVINSSSGKRFIVIDSLSTLLLYNASNTLVKFTHFLTARMKMWGVSGIFITIKDQDDPMLVSYLSQVSDKVLDFSS